MAAEEPHIKVSRNGPYLVSGNVPLSTQGIEYDKEGTALTWSKPKPIPGRANYALCRCGRSQKKPFCDGSHAKKKFDGTETADRTPFTDRAEITEGPELDLADVEPLCAQAGFCQREGGIWDLVPASDDPHKKEVAIEEAHACPAGRLVVHTKDGQPIEPAFKPGIVVTEDPQAPAGGPLWVQGGIPIEAADSTEYERRNRVTLCRCGRSKNKPFCDGTHMD